MNWVQGRGLMLDRSAWMRRRTPPYKKRDHPCQQTRPPRPQPLFSIARDDLLFCYGEYRRLMAHARAVLPTGCYCELHYEALVTNPEAETRALLDFCGLHFHDACLAPERNARVVRTASVWQARQPIYTKSVGHWQNYERWLPEFEALAAEE